VSVYWKPCLQGSFADAVQMTSTRQENFQSWKEGKNRCGTPTPALPPRLTIFLWPLLKTCHFQGIWKKEVASELYIYKRFPPKDLEKILWKNIIPNAHACMQSCTTRTRAQNSRCKYKRNASYWCGCFSHQFFFSSKVENFPVWYSFFSGHSQGCLSSLDFPHICHFKGIRVCPSRSEDSFDSVHDVLESHLLKLWSCSLLKPVL